MKNSEAIIKVPLAAKFLRLATSFAENSALVFGLTERQAMETSLAAEEIFMHAVNFAPPDEELEIRVEKGSYYTGFEYILPSERLKLAACNITATLSPDDQDSVDQMGLFLASRLVDRFSIESESGGRIKLTLIKEKKYAPAVPTSHDKSRPLDKWSVIPPSSQAEILLFLELVNSRFPRTEIPNFMKYPEKTAEMIQGNDCRAALAVSPSGLIGGGVVWMTQGQRTVEFFGPYLLGQPADSSMTRDLIDFCLNDLARTNCVNLIGRYIPTPPPAGYFQRLGALDIVDEHDTWSSKEALFRLLGEDMGELVWSHPTLVDYLEKEYERLSLPREVQTILSSKAPEADCSIISSQRSLSERNVILRPALSGPDIEQNLHAHVNLFKNEGVRMVLFEIDLGVPGHLEFIPALLGLGFSPRLILPYAGKKDILILQLDPSRT